MSDDNEEESSNNSQHIIENLIPLADYNNN